MKKLLLALGLVLCLASVSYGQGRQVYQSFLAGDIATLCVSNAVNNSTYAHGVTNLSSYGVITTNVIGTTWTNGSGSRVATAGANASIDYKNLLADVDLASLKKPDFLPLDTVPIVTTAYTNTTFCSIFIRMVGQSGANAAVTFVFKPIFDDENNLAEGGAANTITIAVTATAATPVVSVTQVPAWQIYGASKLRLVSVSNADTDATSRVDIFDCGLVGYQY